MFWKNCVFIYPELSGIIRKFIRKNTKKTCFFYRFIRLSVYPKIGFNVYPKIVFFLQFIRFQHFGLSGFCVFSTFIRNSCQLFIRKIMFFKQFIRYVWKYVSKNYVFCVPPLIFGLKINQISVNAFAIGKTFHDV